MKQIALVFAMAAVFAGCEQNEVTQPTADNGNGNGNGTSECTNGIDDLPLQSLTAVEEADLLFMREEEKVARDLYLAFYDDWGLNPFNNIASSEQSHMDALLVLIDRYELTDPVLGGQGTFNDPDLQELYDVLLAAGEPSSLEALKVGALVEETDIVDLQVAVDRTDNDDITLVYENLMKGSRNHLRSYYDQLLNKGFTYVPTVLSQDEFDAIVNSPHEMGN